jgi:hypothetical protein
MSEHVCPTFVCNGVRDDPGICGNPIRGVEFRAKAPVAPVVPARSGNGTQILCMINRLRGGPASQFLCDLGEVGSAGLLHIHDATFGHCDETSRMALRSHLPVCVCSPKARWSLYVAVTSLRIGTHCRLHGACGEIRTAVQTWVSDYLCLSVIICIRVWVLSPAPALFSHVRDHERANTALDRRCSYVC